MMAQAWLAGGLPFSSASVPQGHKEEVDSDSNEGALGGSCLASAGL